MESLCSTVCPLPEPISSELRPDAPAAEVDAIHVLPTTVPKSRESRAQPSLSVGVDEGSAAHPPVENRFIKARRGCGAIAGIVISSE